MKKNLKNIKGNHLIICDLPHSFSSFSFKLWLLSFKRFATI